MHEPNKRLLPKTAIQISLLSAKAVLKHLKHLKTPLAEIYYSIEYGMLINSISNGQSRFICHLLGALRWVRVCAVNCAGMVRAVG